MRTDPPVVKELEKTGFKFFIIARDAKHVRHLKRIIGVIEETETNLTGEIIFTTIKTEVVGQFWQSAKKDLVISVKDRRIELTKSIAYIKKLIATRLPYPIEETV